MPVMSTLKTIATYVVLGPPIGTLAFTLCLAVTGSIDISYMPPSLEANLKGFLLVLLGGYVLGSIPAAFSGVAHAYARAHSFGRSQTVGLASAGGAAVAAAAFNLLLPDMWVDKGWQSIAFPVASGLVAAVCVSVFLTHVQSRIAT